MQPSAELLDALPDNVLNDDSDETDEISYGSELADFLGRDALNDEFTSEQVRVLQDLVMKAVPSHDHIEMCNYLVSQVNKMNVYSPKKEKKIYLSLQNDRDRYRRINQKLPSNRELFCCLIL